VSDTEQEYLVFAFNFLTKILLKRQIEAFKSNAPVTRFIDPKTLSRQEKETLLRALRHVEAFRKRLKAEVTGDVF
jgi:signal-transduction protein with cAMP-binding, CBS, and nucleotidyltransferase domain